MKALKEKRVSLRSLWRRGLIILSLFALVFAACGEGGSPGGFTQEELDAARQEGKNEGLLEGEAAGIEKGKEQAKLPKITSITVLHHPVNPSFEGAAPDLKGLQVWVTWEDNKIPPAKVEAGDPKLIIDPPVAFVTTAGINEETFSKLGAYKVKYVDDELWVTPDNMEETVYIPAVVAMVSPIVTAPSLGTGAIPVIYEDEGIQPTNVAGLNFTATYIAFNGPTVLATIGAAGNLIPPGVNNKVADYGVAPAGGAFNPWGNLASEARTNPVSTSSKVWRVEAVRDNYGKGFGRYFFKFGNNYTTAANWIGTVAERDAVSVVAPITTFYWIGRFDWKSGGPTKNYRPRSPFPALTSDGWLSELYDVKDNLKFTVTYYNLATEGEDRLRPVERTFNDYYRAMFVFDSFGNARATKPALIGIGDLPAGHLDTVADAVENDYSLALGLYYYNPEIKGRPGEGTVDILTVPNEYVTLNNARVPITVLEDYEYTFQDELKKERRDKTIVVENEDDFVGPVISGRETDKAKNDADLFRELKYFWKVWYVRVREDPAGVDPVLEVDYPTAANTDAWPAAFAGSGITLDYENDPVEVAEIRDVTVTFPSPPAGYLPDGYDMAEVVDSGQEFTVAFRFWMVP